MHFSRNHIYTLTHTHTFADKWCGGVSLHEITKLSIAPHQQQQQQHQLGKFLVFWRELSQKKIFGCR